MAGKLPAVIGLALSCILLSSSPVTAAAEDAALDTRIADSPALRNAEARLRDAETLRNLSSEGQLLYRRDRIKLDGYQYCSQAVSLAERGEFRQSIQAASKALNVGQQQGDDNLLAAAKRDLAIAYSYAGDLEHAEQYAREALKHRARDPRKIAGPAYKTLGDVSVRRGNIPEAIAYYEQAMQSSSENFQPLIQISLANAYVAAGRAEEARVIYEKIKLPKDSSLRQLYQRGLGNLLLVEGKPREALEQFSAASENARGPDSDYHRLWAQEGKARSLLALDDKEAARQAYLEAARLSESIRARFRSEEFKTGLFGDVQQIFERAIALSMEADDVETAWNLSEASRSRALLDIVRERVALSTDAKSDELYVKPIPLSAVRAELREGEAIVEYHSLEDRLLAWVIRPAGIGGFVIKRTRVELDDAIEEFREKILDRSRDINQSGQKLYDWLIAPLAIKSNERLLIVPHGGLHYLPFQALRGADGYLIEQHPLAITPSASVATQLANKSKGGKGRLVAFGNPEIGVTPETGKQYALPNAEQEVTRIAALFPEKQVFLKREATKQSFQKNANAPILHVAAHAEVDVIDPLQSRILFSADDPHTGSLAARELYGIDLGKVSLVTLSACESGLGRIARGDEILGFTRSFLTAGASGLFMSLWPVSDESTEALMTALYAELAKGAEAVQAMQTAQLAVLKRPRFKHPFFWAPFNLIGDWRMQIRG